MKTKTKAPSFKGFNLQKHSVSSEASDIALADELCAPCPRLDVRVVEVTPGLAVELLRRGAWEDYLSRKLVTTYASDMKAGAWQVSHQGIGIGHDGRLFDGRHRLWAVVHAGVAVQMLCIRGVDPISREAMDTGRVRSVGETVLQLDEDPHGNRFVPWLKAIAVLHGQPASGLSRHAMREQIARFRPSLRWVLDRSPREAPYNRASVLGALVYAHSVLGDRMEPFVKDYASGEDLSPGHPALALRLYVGNRMRHVSDSDRAPHLKTLRCARAFLENEPIDRMPTSEHGYRYFRARETPQLTLPLSA